MPVALVGRVPVNVTNEGGAIAAGDYIGANGDAISLNHGTVSLSLRQAQDRR